MRRAVGLGALARARRRAFDLASAPPISAVNPLEAAFERALDHLWPAFQPIVRWPGATAYAYEALLRTRETAFRGPQELMDTAEAPDSLVTQDREIAKYSAAVAFGATNKVDAAIGSVLKGKVSAGVLGIGPVTSWRAAADVAVGLAVQCSGRVAPYVRTGTVDGVNASIFVTINGQSYLFVEQLLLSEMASPGDSGALLMATDGSAVGLIFAAGQGCTYANAIENVQTALNVTVADTKWT